MNAFARIRCVTLLSFFPLLPLFLSGRAFGQEACIPACKFPDYPGITFTLGEGFLAKGGDVKVTHMGFLKSAYNNDGSVQTVGLPTVIGGLSFINPVTGEEKALFQNQTEPITHANDSGMVIDLGIFPKGAPIVFKYKNITGTENKRFDRFTGASEAGVYDFNADPVLKGLFINGKPKPVSGGFWNWSGIDHYQWAIAGIVPGTDVKQFQFEDLDDRRFNDIVFRVSGVALTSETFKLEAPVLEDSHAANGDIQVAVKNPVAVINQGDRLFYTVDGSFPAFDSAGTPAGTTREYTAPIAVTVTTTIKAVAWKKNLTDAGGNTSKYEPSTVVSGTYAVTRKQWSTPAANPPGGGFSGTVNVTLTQAEGAKMYYRICDALSACSAPDAGSPVYAGTPLAITAAKILTVIAIQSPEDNSEVATFAYTPVFRVTDAVYLDGNGDGHIESARLTLDGAPVTLPASVLLEDPFNPGSKLTATGLQWLSAAHDGIRVDFAATPFAMGTGFTAGPFGTFTNGNTSYPAASFHIRDGAGPVAVSAFAEVSLDSGSSQSLKVKFSEALLDPLKASVPGEPLPFNVKRGAESLAAKLQVGKVEDLGDDTYRYTFSSAIFPMPGDSLQATAAARDGSGNPSNMAAWIGIQGQKPSLTLTLKVAGGGCVHGSDIPNPGPLTIPLTVILPRSSGPASGCIEARRPVQCLDCQTGEWKQSDSRRPDAGGIPVGPEIQVTTRWPFTFDLEFFSTLGELVNHAKGEVTERMLQGVAPDARGNKVVSLQWYPVSAMGMQAGTGAYIAKGSVRIKADPSQDTYQGIPVVVQSAEERVLLRFGYLR